MASADEKPWSVDTAARVYGQQVILLKRVYVLPWTQFLYAEGTSEEVRAFFSMHDVVVKGLKRRVRSDWPLVFLFIERFLGGGMGAASHHKEKLLSLYLQGFSQIHRVKHLYYRLTYR